MSDRDVLAETEERLWSEPAAAAALVAELSAALARVSAPRDAGRHMLALATAHLAAEQPARARELLTDAAPLVADDALAALRCRLRLAAAEAALGERRAARRHLAGLDAAALLALEDPGLLREAAATLRAAGEDLAAGLLEAAPARAPATGVEPRLGALARLLQVLGSCAVGTAEPLYAALRAILDESGADRGFLMLYEGAALRFRLGLTSQGRILGPDDFAYSSTIVGRALQSGRAVLVPDVAREAPLAQATSARELGLGSAVCVPLRVERKRVGAAPVASLPTVRGIAGVLYVDAAAAARFDEGQRELFEACACCAVLAVREAQAYDALRAATRAAPAASRPDDAPRPQGRLHVAGPLTAGVVAEDEAMRQVMALVLRAAPVQASVLIRGESGAGKEVVARALHAASGRGPLVTVDCGAIAEELAMTELFGHERGAFTGANDARPGLIERAHGGTLLLDEVGDMPAGMQAALLRALQEGEVRRVGGDVSRTVDVRIVATTQRDLRAMVERREFRADLLYRIAAVEVRVPPLRERPKDLPLLVEHLLRAAAAESGRPVDIEEVAIFRLLEHPWAGNVRELENVLVRARLAARGDVITLADVDLALDDAGPKASPGPVAQPAGLAGTLEDVERALLVERLAQHRGNKVHAARSLGIDRNTLRRKMLRFGIPGP